MSESPQSESRERTESFVSVVFWCTLFCAAGIYASVALAPKVQQLLVLERDRAANQWHLVALDDRVQHLGKVARALEKDPDFAAELARSRFGALSAGQAAVSVSEELRLNTSAAPRARRVDLPWFYPLVRLLAESTAVRWTLLTLSAGMLLLGFAFLHAGYADSVDRIAGRMRQSLRKAGQRYAVKDA